MSLPLPLGEEDLLLGFEALRDVHGRTLSVIADPNNSANTPDSTTVGTSFNAVVSPATPDVLSTELGADYRFDAIAEVDKADDLEVEETARLSDGVTTWRVAHYDRNASVATNKYFLIEVDPEADT